MKGLPANEGEIFHLSVGFSSNFPFEISNGKFDEKPTDWRKIFPLFAK